MNSEELELSLRTEFDDHLKKVFSDMREDISGFQEKIEAAIEVHKSQMEDVFRQFATQFENENELDEGFKSSIIEHLRLAKDEGARITAEAVAEAEKFDEENKAAAPEADFSGLRDAINEISKQDSQAEILKSLVNHASDFTPRGAFFIIKNEHFVGWRVFGREEQEDDQAIGDVFFPTSDSTLLGEAARTLETAEGSFGGDGEDSVYLGKLDFGQPDRMYAIPLIARGRSVAMLYADYGQEGTNVNVEALETLVSVAGLTVELLAASRSSKAQRVEQQETAYADDSETEETESSFESEDSQATEDEFSYQSPVETSDSEVEATDETEETSEAGFAFHDYPSSEDSEEEEADEKELARQEEVEETEFQPVSEETDWSQPSEVIETSDDEVAEIPEYSDDYESETESYQPVTAEDDPSKAPTGEYQFDSDQVETPAEVEESPAETANFDSSQFETFVPTQSEDSISNDTYAPVATDDYSEVAKEFDSFDSAPAFSDEAAAQETVIEPVVTEPIRSRFSDRNVDLPIEVGEDERRLHNDARRFARLLVSEIKLYNEQKVKEGRESNDLYDRLREAIDRSREMYDKRVQSPVSAKFDYFHYELVNSLADGDEAVLGETYAGAAV